MAETITMPKLGFDMAEGTLVRWVIGEGEQVAKGAVLAEIETDKATVEVESAYEGTLRKHLVNQGDVVPVGTPIAIVGSPDEKIDEGASVEQIKEGSAEVPPGGFTNKEVVEGKPAAGAGQSAQIAVQDLPGKDIPEQEAEPEEESPFPGGVRASPVARRMAEEQGIDLSRVQGTGPNGRIVRKDVEDFQAQAAQAAPAAASAPVPAATAQPTPTRASAPQAGERVPLNRLRAAIGRRMVEAKQQIPHFYITHDYDVAELLEYRKQANGILPEDEKISVNDFIIKAVALTLRQFPNLNASLNGNEIIRHGSVNIGVAVAVEGGLLTVVCRDADSKSIRQISQEVRTMAGRAREGKVRPDDIEGSTFSISNLGMFDVEDFVAIINPPEAAILAVGSAREVPVVKDGNIQPGWRMKATISVDHRVSDGAEGARFMQALAGFLEKPMLAVL